MAETSSETLGSNGTPFWFKVLDRYGFPTLIAGVLLYFVLWWGSNMITSFTNALSEMAKSQAAHALQMRIDQVENRYYQRQVCLNTAKTAQQQAACYQDPRGN